MTLMRAGTLARGRAVMLVLLGAAALAGCRSSNLNSQVTGSQGGLLPGMTRPEPPPDKNAPPPAVPTTTTEKLSDGSIVQTQTLGDRVYSKTWFSPQGKAVRAIFYQNGVIPVAMEEYDQNGQVARVTQWFPGTSQPQRIEEYAGGSVVTRFTTYWPNGNRRVLSEAAIPTPAGAVNRVQQWYENGRPKSLVQLLVLPNGGTMQQGRQTNWDENGFVVYDAEFDHNILVHDYMTKRAAPW